MNISLFWKTYKELKKMKLNEIMINKYKYKIKECFGTLKIVIILQFIINI